MDNKIIFVKKGEEINCKGKIELYHHPCMNPFNIVVSGKEYQLKLIHFFDKNGIKYSAKQGWLNKKSGSNNYYSQIIICDEVILKRKPDFNSSHPFIISRGKEKYDTYTQADIYLPVEWFELAENIKESSGLYKTLKYHYASCEYFDILLKIDVEDNFENWKNDLLKSLDECTDREQAKNIFEKFILQV